MPDRGSNEDAEAPTVDSATGEATRRDAGVAPGSGQDTVLPDEIGGYHVIRLLGEGGMGSVYLAEQSEPVQRTVALKVIKLGMDTGEVVARFESERQALAIMNHPYIAKVFDAGSTPEGRPYFVMEVAEGVSITRFCDQHKLGIKQRLEVFIKVCSAIQHAHQKGIIHRDIKPSNILVAEGDDGPFPRVIDFGIAKATGDPHGDETSFTHQGAVIGTPEYMSPEQAGARHGDVDTRTDVYSLGVVLYRLLVGVLPLDRDVLRGVALDEMLRMIRDDEPSTLSSRLSALGEESWKVAAWRCTDTAALRRRLQGDLDWIVMKAIDKDPDRRYQSASEFAADLNRHLDNEPVVARSPTLSYRLGKFARKNKGALSAVAAVFVVLVIGIVASTWLAIEATRARTQAQQRRAQAEDLIGFMIGDLRDKLAPVGRLDILDDVGAKALEYFDSLTPEELTDEERYRLSTTLTQIGEVRFNQGSLDGALEALEPALVLAREVVAADPGQTDWQLGLGAIHFWLGYVHWQREDLEVALEEFLAYLEVAEELVAIDADNLDFQRERGYAHSNIGFVRQQQGDLDGALEQFELCLAIEQAITGADPGNLDFRLDVADSHNAVGLVLQTQGHLDEAQRHFMADLSIKESLVDADPGNTEWRRRLAATNVLVADHLVVTGDAEGALAHGRAAAAIMDALTKRDPTNTRWRHGRADAGATIGRSLHVLGDVDAAAERLRGSVFLFSELVGSDPSNTGWQHYLAGAQIRLGNVLAARGDLEEALREAEGARNTLAALLENDAADFTARRLLGSAYLSIGGIHAQRDDQLLAEANWRLAAEGIEPLLVDAEDRAVLVLWTRVLIRLGRLDEATPIVAELDAIGYRDPDLERLLEGQRPADRRRP